MESECEMIRMQHEQQVKAKEAELVRGVLALEFDRQKQKEEAERLAYERKQLEYVHSRCIFMHVLLTYVYIISFTNSFHPLRNSTSEH